MSNYLDWPRGLTTPWPDLNDAIEPESLIVIAAASLASAEGVAMRLPGASVECLTLADGDDEDLVVNLFRRAHARRSGSAGDLVVAAVSVSSQEGIPDALLRHADTVLYLVPGTRTALIVKSRFSPDRRIVNLAAAA